MNKLIILVVLFCASMAFAQDGSNYSAKYFAEHTIESYKVSPDKAIDALTQVYPQKSKELTSCLKYLSEGVSESDVISCIVREIPALSNLKK